MKPSSDPSIHRHRQEQIVQHVQKLLADERLRIDTTHGRRPVTMYLRDVSHADQAYEVKKAMIELGVSDRELQNKLPVGQMLEVALSQTKWFFFNTTVGRLRLVCISPTRRLIEGQAVEPMAAGEVAETLAKMPPSLGGAPMTIILMSSAGFVPEARELASSQNDRTVILVEPNDAGGWSAYGPAEAKSLLDLLDPEGDGDKRQRVLALIEENKVDLLTSGITTDKLASKAHLPLAFVETVVKDYARQNAGLSAKRLDGRFVLFREGSGALATSRRRIRRFHGADG